MAKSNDCDALNRSSRGVFITTKMPSFQSVVLVRCLSLERIASANWSAAVDEATKTLGFGTTSSSAVDTPRSYAEAIARSICEREQPTRVAPCRMSFLGRETPRRTQLRRLVAPVKQTHRTAVAAAEWVQAVG